MERTFSDRLGELIKRKQITQRKLSEQVGVTEAAMSHYLKGDRYPRASVLSKIADALGTTSDFLMNGIISDTNAEINQAKRLIARNVTQMSVEEKMEIVSILFEKE